MERAFDRVCKSYADRSAATLHQRFLRVALVAAAAFGVGVDRLTLRGVDFVMAHGVGSLPGHVGMLWLATVA